MRCLVFDISGEYGHFKKPYSPASPVSYPVPPPTAILGMLGAILGYSKTEYHQKLNWQTIRIGIRLLEPVQVFRAAINLLNTKEADSYFRPILGKNTHSQIPFEFLKSPAFRIYLKDLSKENFEKLKDLLPNNQTLYTPVLGLANCLAETQWVGTFELEPFENKNWETSCAVPMMEGLKIHYEDARHYHRLKVPTEMDEKRIVHRYQEIVLAEDIKPISGEGGKNLFYRIENNEIITFL
ncbi:MAG: hypothetical protein RIT27_1668 [Pseudomonadota bacterium]|jgi:CRISPR-associated protein Cas5h